MGSFAKYCLLIASVLFYRCETDIPDKPDDTDRDTLTGMVEFDFAIPHRNVPEEGIHRIDLSLAKNAYDLYRGHFMITANTYDVQQKYAFHLIPGQYYFQAGIVCTCLGDTCLWDGFPGGRYGTKWVADKIIIEKGVVLRKPITFTN